MKRSIEEQIEETDDFCERECFIFYMNKLFESAPYKKQSKPCENGLHPFLKEGLGDYIMRLYPMFQSILHTSVEKVDMDYFQPKESDEKIAKFVVAVIAHGLRQGGCVERYLKDVSILPYFVKKILKIKRGRLFLANSDVESLDFKLALLTSIPFMDERHSLLFEKKARVWVGES